MYFEENFCYEILYFSFFHIAFFNANCQNILKYDPALAEKLGAYDYGMKEYVLDTTACLM